MRESLYRGRYKESGKFVFGDLLQGFGGRKYIITLCDNTATWNFTPRLLFEEVVPETVGQFTGLLDKNGAKIFEGDIVKHGHTCRYSDGQTRDFYYNLLVRFSENHGAWLTGDSKYLTPRNLKKYSIEVMGNIHDNPELLMEEL